MQEAKVTFKKSFRTVYGSLKRLLMRHERMDNITEEKSLSRIG